MSLDACPISALAPWQGSGSIVVSCILILDFQAATGDLRGVAAVTRSVVRILEGTKQNHGALIDID